MTAAEILARWSAFVNTWNAELFNEEERPREVLDMRSGDLASLDATVMRIGDVACDPPKTVARIVYREDNYINVECEDGTVFRRCYPRDWSDDQHAVEFRPQHHRAEPVCMRVQFDYTALPTAQRP